MTNRRALTWSTAMRDLRGERMTRAAIREERLRSTAGLRTGDGLTSWLGRSGRRYVVGVHEPHSPELAEVTEAVVIAVRRSQDGVARVLDVVAPEPGSTRRARLRWLSLMRTRGATELHVHLLAESAAERAAIRRDLATMNGDDAVSA